LHARTLPPSVLLLSGLTLGLNLAVPRASAAPPAPSSGEGVAVTAANGEEAPWSFQVSAVEGYRGRFASAPDLDTTLDPATLPSESDHDLRLLLDARLDEPTDAFSAALNMALWADVDGTVPAGDPSGLASMYDRFSPGVWVGLYSLWGEYRTRGLLRAARAGRQQTLAGLPAVFDGASFRLRLVPRKLELFAFGGRTVHFFEVGSDLFEDWIGSAGLTYRPTPSLRFKLDYRFEQEDTPLEDGAQDHTYSLQATWRHDRWLSLRANFRGVDDRVAQVALAGDARWEALGLGVTARVAAQPSTLDHFTETEDPFFATLGRSRPYTRASVDVFKDFDTDAGIYTLHAGWGQRLLLDGAPGPFNRNFGRFYLLAEATDLGVKGLYASASAEYHFAGRFDADTGLLTAGGSLGYRNDALRLEAGTYYQRVKYDYFADVREVTDVRTVYGSARWKPVSWLGLRARYELEVYDRTVHTVNFSLAQTF